MSAQGNEAGAQDAASLKEEINQLWSQLAQLQAGIEQERSRRFVNRVVEAAQGTRALKAEIELLQSQLAEANEARAQERANMEAQIANLQEGLERERSRGFFRKLFGLGPRLPEDTEQTRERMRGRLAVRLVWTLIVVIVGTYAYLWIGNLNPTELNTIVPMVGTTLLTPLIGLIGAVMGFYYGGQTAVQAASQTAEATKTAAQAATAAQSVTAAQIVAQTAAQKATTPQSAAAAQTAAQMTAQTAAQMTNGGNVTNGTLGSNTVSR